MIHVLLTTVGGGVGQSVLRALQLSKLNLRIVGVDMDPWGAGLYRCDTSYLVPPDDHPSYVDKVLNICENEQIDIIIPGSDPELPVLASKRKCWGKRVGFPAMTLKAKYMN